MIIPHDNERDLREIPEKIREKLDVRLVDHIDEVIPLVFSESTHVYTK